jgi:hypothetical protein
VLVRITENHKQRQCYIRHLASTTTVEIPELVKAKGNEWRAEQSRAESLDLLFLDVMRMATPLLVLPPLTTPAPMNRRTEQSLYVCPMGIWCRWKELGRPSMAGASRRAPADGGAGAADPGPPATCPGAQNQASYKHALSLSGARWQNVGHSHTALHISLVAKNFTK